MVEEGIAKGVELAVMYTPKLVITILTLVVGLWIIRMILSMIDTMMSTYSVDETLRKFLSSFVGISLKLILVISVVSMLGVKLTSLIAVLGAATLAVGMALKGSLSNFAGGVMILLFRPFKVGDLVTAGGHTGVVSAIQIFNTILKTPENRTVIIPNGIASEGPIVNFTTETNLRVDVSIGIGYGDDIDRAREVIEGVIGSNKSILTDPAPAVLVAELGDNSVNFSVRVWAASADYWNVFFYMNEALKKAFDKEGISIPFPQRDVHIFNQK